MPLIAYAARHPNRCRYPPLELTPQRQKQRTLAALLKQLAGLAAAQPVLAVYEDVHWSDPTTLELLGLTIERIPAPAGTCADHLPARDRPPWLGAAHAARWRSPAGAARRRAMVDRVVGAKTLPAEVDAQIVAKTDGVPLFVEELTKMVIESELLPMRATTTNLTGPLPPLAIPATLHDSLMARLDRLAAVKEVAQLGAVIGGEFSYALLAAVADRPEAANCAPALDQLVASELVLRRGAPPYATYTFKHALVQDVAYQSLLKAMSSSMLASPGCSRSGFRNGCYPARAARPALHGGGSARSGGGLLAPGRAAGERALGRSEAIAHLTKGLELAHKLPDPTQAAHQELKLLVACAGPLVRPKGSGALRWAASSPGVGAVQRGGRNAPSVPTMWGLWHFYWVQGASTGAGIWPMSSWVWAEQEGDPMLLLAAHQALGRSLYRLGDSPPAVVQLEQARAGLEPKLDPSPHLRYAIAPV